jgi:hypothetical protein
MIFDLRACTRLFALGVVLYQTVGPVELASADHGARRARRTTVVTRARSRVAPAPNTTLGIFQPTPYITVIGNDYVGAGYSPLGIYGDQTMSLYGPFSPFRATTAPVLTYVRGYDGQLRTVEAASFSYPNLPPLSPVIYPTEANYYYAPRVSRTPPWWSNPINWIDQN